MSAASGRGTSVAARELARIEREIVVCRACPRLVEWREHVAREKVARFADQTYWGRPVPGFGDPAARVAIVGLAPAAHGGNRTGRIFTGDRSGDFLFASLSRTGFANQSTSIERGDGLELRGAYVAAVNRCVPPGNRPTPEERDRCLPFLVHELRALRPESRLFALLWEDAPKSISAVIASRDSTMLKNLAVSMSSVPASSYFIANGFSAFSEAEIKIRGLIRRVL